MSVTRNESTSFKSHGACGSTAETPTSISISSFRISAKMSTNQAALHRGLFSNPLLRVTPRVRHRHQPSMEMLVDPGEPGVDHCECTRQAIGENPGDQRVLCLGQLLSRRSAWWEDNATSLEGSAADECGFGASCVSASRASPSAPLGVGVRSAMKSTRWDPPGSGASDVLVNDPDEMPQYNSTSKVAESYFIVCSH